MNTQLRPTRRHVLAGSAALAAVTFAAAPRANAAANAQTRINIAGFQRTLTQLVAVGAIYSRLGIEPTRHLAQMGESRDEFDRVLGILRTGSKDLNLSPETNTRVLESLASVEGLWAPFSAATRAAVAAGGVDDETFGTIASLNKPLLQTSDNVVTQLVSAYGASDIEVGLAVSINIAGRQRTRIQEIAKDMGLIGLEDGAETRLATLESDATLLDDSLNALISGLDEVSLPPPPDHIRLKLLEVRSGWKSYKDVVDKVLATGAAGPAELYVAAAQTNPLMRAMDEAVTLYTEL